MASSNRPPCASGPQLSAASCITKHWTPTLIKALLRALVDVEAKLPKPGPRGHARAVLGVAESKSGQGSRAIPIPPHEDDVRLLLVVSGWMLWLEETERHLLRMHARGIPRDAIGRKLGISRSSVWRNWQAAINKLVIHLNSARIPPQLPRSVR
jgi:hypothetical protein